MTDGKRSIAPPDPDRPPLKANVFEAAQNTATTLAPLFPYIDEGSIVPCISVFRGGPGRQYGRFQHLNNVDEVIMMVGFPSGLVYVGPKLHPVGAPFEAVEDPESRAVALITQRQLIGKVHTEEYRFLCDACNRLLSKARFDATPPRRGEASGARSTFPTIVEGYKAARAHNEHEENRRCGHCGHTSERFPLELWGWAEYAEQSEVARHTEAAMRAAGDGLAESPEAGD